MQQQSDEMLSALLSAHAAFQFRKHKGYEKGTSKMFSLLLLLPFVESYNALSIPHTKGLELAQNSRAIVICDHFSCLICLKLHDLFVFKK